MGRTISKQHTGWVAHVPSSIRVGLRNMKAWCRRAKYPGSPGPFASEADAALLLQWERLLDDGKLDAVLHAKGWKKPAGSGKAATTAARAKQAADSIPAEDAAAGWSVKSSEPKKKDKPKTTDLSEGTFKLSPMGWSQQVVEADKLASTSYGVAPAAS